jgi:predicted transcriptional regulator of viral defense system
MLQALPLSMRTALQLAQRQGVLRARDLDSCGIARSTLQELRDRGLLLHVGRGLYLPADAVISEYQTLIEVARRVPHGVVCLLSALRFHEIGTQEPPVLWLCIESRTRAPKLDYPLLEIVRQSGQAWIEGVEEHLLPIGEAQVAVRITSPAKTIADCFKFRSRVGLDVALEALRDGLRQKKVTHRELWQYANVDRVSNVMRPYLEAMSTP